MRSIQLQIFPVNMQYTDCNKKDRVTKLLHFACTTDLERPGQITLHSLSKSHLDVTSLM